jgi:hypothetical protein
MLYQDAAGISVMVAELDLVVSATLVAVTVTVSCAPMVDGGVYSPVAESVPTFGLIAAIVVIAVLTGFFYRRKHQPRGKKEPALGSGQQTLDSTLIT